MNLNENLERVRARIAAAAEVAGRDAKNVRLLAVSKFQPAGAIREAYALGQRDFAENYVQELHAKTQELADLLDLRWHLIGHLQRNKARKIAALVASVHTLDSVELVEELGRRVAGCEGERRARFGAERERLRVLVEVSIASEAQKSGVAAVELEPVLAAIEREPALELAGLMCVPPLTAEPEHARPFFKKLAELRAAHGGVARLPELSMGMTADLEVAVAEGATLVRVGTAIFGERPPRAF